MRPKNSRARGSAPRVIRPVQFSSDGTKTQPRDATTSDYAAVVEQCLDLWAKILTRFVAIQREILERQPVRVTIVKRLNTIFRSAQAGFQDALGMKIHCEAHSGASEWEMAKREFEPWMREAAEAYSSHMLKRCPISSPQELEQSLDDEFQSPIDGKALPLVRSDEPLSRANETAELLMQSCKEQIAIMQTLLSQIDERDDGAVFQEGLSERANTARFRNRTSSLKRMISTLLAAQQGLQSALTAKMHFKRKSATPDWPTAKVQMEIGFREQCEKMWLMMTERSRVFGMPMPHLCEGIDYGPHKSRVAALFGIAMHPPTVVKCTKLREVPSQFAHGSSMAPH